MAEGEIETGKLEKYLVMETMRNNPMTSRERVLAAIRGLLLLLEEFGNQAYALELGADIAILSPAISSPVHFLGSIRKRSGRLSFIGPFGSVHGMFCKVTWRRKSMSCNRSSRKRGTISPQPFANTAAGCHSPRGSMFSRASGSAPKKSARGSSTA